MRATLERPRPTLAQARRFPRETQVSPTDYRLKDGDTVQLLQPAPVDGYWYDPVYAPRGYWKSFYVLSGTVGRVVRARTPCVTGPATYFANIDVVVSGQTHRVRLTHDQFKKVRAS